MKTTKNDSTSEILKEFVFPLTIVKDLAEECGHSGFVVDSLMIKLERALQRQREEIVKSFRDEVIGEDEDEPKTISAIARFAPGPSKNDRRRMEDRLLNRNKLRAEQRQKLDGLLK